MTLLEHENQNGIDSFCSHSVSSGRRQRTSIAITTSDWDQNRLSGQCKKWHASYLIEKFKTLFNYKTDQVNV